MSDPVVSPQRWIHSVDESIYTFHFDGKKLTLTGGPNWSTGVDSEHIFTATPVRVSDMLAAMSKLWTKTYEWMEALNPVTNLVIAYPQGKSRG